MDMADCLSGGGVAIARLLLALAGRLEKGRRGRRRDGLGGTGEGCVQRGLGDEDGVDAVLDGPDVGGLSEDGVASGLVLGEQRQPGSLVTVRRAGRMPM